MKIAFVTTQSLGGSTMLGRVLPLVFELKHVHEVHILGLSPAGQERVSEARWHSVGQEPFVRHTTGKQRKKGARLVGVMLMAALKTALVLSRLSPEVVVIVKPLPANVLGAYLWSWRRRSTTIILDVDDFELLANRLSSLLQRAAVHWSERVALRLSRGVVAATPFLADHFEQLKPQVPVKLIPTGFTPRERIAATSHGAVTLVYLGSLSVSSGHHVEMLPPLLKSIHEQWPEIKLIVAGSGDDEEKLRQAFAQAGLANSVAWTGRFAPDRLASLLPGNSLLLDPIDDSIIQRSKSSFRVAVAAAYGLPVVTSNIGIRPYLLPPPLHHRLFARPGSVADYLRVIRDIITSPLSAADREALKTQAAKYYWSTLARQYEEFITTL